MLKKFFLPSVSLFKPLKSFSSSFPILDHVPLSEIDEKAETFRFLPQILENKDDKRTLENKNQAILNSLSEKLAKIPKEEDNEVKLTNFYQYIKEEILHTQDPLLLQASHHLFSSEGKLVRPKMMLSLHKLLNPLDKNKESDLDKFHLIWAAVIEIMHIASLTHDDILDNAKMRRGLVTVHEMTSKREATFAGNFLIGRAGRKLSSLQKIELFQIYATIMDNLTAGEYIQAAKNRDFSDFPKLVSDYLIKTYYKTASLMTHSCRGVYILDAQHIKNKDPALEQVSYMIGQNLGIAFQLIDDVLDYVVTSEEFGKTSLNDLKEGYLTGPILFALQEVERQGKKGTEKEMKEKLKERKVGEDDVLKFKNIIFEGTGIEKTIYLASLHIERAIHLIESIGQSKELLKLAYSVLVRRK